jgi:KAP family P-loop domain protein
MFGIIHKFIVALLGKLKNKNTMANNEQYPRFIPDKPTGDDVFEGQSQTNLANNICEYIRSNDSASSRGREQMPRIIGLEGKWGSGKSNVVEKIKKDLEGEGYYTFTYDAWGHQEDLQRRSILETLTNALIEDKVLEGKVKIKMRNGESKEAEWKDQLSLLLSNKTTTIIKSQPQLSGSAIWGISLVGLFVISTTIMGHMIDVTDALLSRCWIIFIDILPIIIGGLVIIWYCITGNWKNVFTLLTQKEDNKVDEQFTSSEEPSVMEFKNWMHAISSHLGKAKGNKKVIIVFDNMDRLPSEKVMQLWSVIYTFFAGSDFENIWTIIPYDHKHLCEAIYESNKNEFKDKFKRFINKTFPVVYTVPQPVITDYNKLFNKYFEDAFGTEEHDQKHICQVFMLFHVNPNPRTVISFVNELVAMRLQWPATECRLQNIALFVLKKDGLLYGNNSLEENLLSDALFKDVSSFYPDQESVRTQLCQFAYGLHDKSLAGELPLIRLLSAAVKSGDSLARFVEQPHFISVLENIFAKEVTIESLGNAVKSLSALDINSLSKDDKERIQKKWDMLANLRSEASCDRMQFDDAVGTIIYHATERRVKDMCISYVNAIQTCEIGKGSEYFFVLNKLKTCLDDSGKDVKFEDVIKPIKLEPKHFVEFVVAAGKEYSIYKVSADNASLNEYVFSEIEKGSEGIDEFVELVYQDAAYDFSSLRTNVSGLIKVETNIKEPRIVSYVNRLLDNGDDIITTRFTSSFISQIIQKIDATSAASTEKRGVEDLFAMSLADGHDVANINETIIPRMAGCFEKYLDYSSLLKRSGSQASAYKLLNIYVIKNKLGKTPDVKYAAQNIKTIKQNLALDYSEIFSQFNRWAPEWSDSDETTYTSFCLQDLFDTYKEYSGLFTNGIINLGVRVLKKQPRGFLYSPNSSPNPYWSQFVQSFLGTKFLPDLTNNLYEELKSLLDRVITANGVEYLALLNKLLSARKEMSLLTEYLHNKLNNNFAKHKYQPIVFKVFGELLPYLGSDMDNNTARGLISNFISPVVNDPECAKIIVANKDFYLGVMAHCKEMSQDILKGMKTNANVKNVYSTIAVDIDQLIISDSAGKA